MSSLRVPGIGLIFLTFCLLPVARCEEPERVSACQLKRDPAAFNRKLVEVKGFASHGFEDFTLFDPVCQSWPDVWLEYGGMISSGTTYCCGFGTERTRRKPLVVEGLPVPLLDDERFQEFDHFIQRTPDSLVHAAVVGRFFSGRQRHLPGGAVVWGGFGHMGCCSLLVIQQVLSVDPQDDEDLDYRIFLNTPIGDRVGCWYRDLLPSKQYSDLIEAQDEADSGQREWAFDDPQHVASEVLSRLLRVDKNFLRELKQAGKAQGRITYQWSPRGKRLSYMVVVSRPYWLSFYSKDTKSVAWVVIAAYESSCEKGNPISRIR